MRTTPHRIFDPIHATGLRGSHPELPERGHKMDSLVGLEERVV
jgi:hypothetical protein